MAQTRITGGLLTVVLFYKKLANLGPYLFIYVYLSLQFHQYKLKKHRWCAWDSNPRPQDGRQRLNHGAMAYCYTSPYKVSEYSVTQILNAKCTGIGDAEDWPEEEVGSVDLVAFCFAILLSLE